MYICTKCKTTTDDEDIRTWTEYGRTYANLTCCNSEMLEAILCPICNEWTAKEDLDGCCENCKSDVLNLENAVNFIKDKNLRQEFFVEWLTGSNVSDCSEELIDICEKNWMNKSDKQELIFEYVKQEIDDFVQWYEKKEYNYGNSSINFR